MRKLPFILIIIACMCWVGIVVLKTQTNIKTVICENCPTETLATLATLKDRNIFTVGRKTVEELLVQHDLALVSYKKQLPHGLIVQAASNPPIYAIRNEQDGKTYKVTKAGLKVETTQSNDLPVFVMDQEIPHQQLIDLLSFFTFMPNQQPIIILTKNWAELTPKQGIPFIFNPAEPSQQKEAITYLVTHWPETLPKETQEIDVRFRLPVARSIRTKPGDAWALQAAEAATTSTEIMPPTASSAAGL